MSVAGVRVDGVMAIWAHVLNHDVAVKDRVVVRTPNGEVEGVVFVAPHQLVRVVDGVEAHIVGVTKHASSTIDCRGLPVSDLPFLGVELVQEGRRGIVTQVDVIRRLVTLTESDGRTQSFPADEMTEKLDCRYG